MGSAASAESARATISSIIKNRPMDASDITDLETAKAEIRNLRKIAMNLQSQWKDESVPPTPATAVKKRGAVYDKNEQAKGVGAYEPKLIPKSNKIRDLIQNVVGTNILFSSYTVEEHKAIVDAFEPLTVTNGVFVIRQGESGDHFYVVESGTLDIFVRGQNGEQTKVGSTLGPGSCFGELALMYNTPRAASIRSTSECVLWQIDRSSYRQIVVHFKLLRNREYMEFLRNVEIMDKKLGLIMSESELEKMTISLEREQYEQGDIIIRQGNTGDQFYIIAEGLVGVYRSEKVTEGSLGNQLAVLKQGAYFGEKALLKEDVRQASCKAETKVLVLSLGRDDFIDMIGSIEEMIEKEKKKAQAGEKVASPREKDMKDEGSMLNITLNDLDVKSTLGCGAFGRVKLCKYPKNNTFYALKCQAKRSIVESGLQEHVLNEMRVMKKVHHPFIAKLFASLQDKYFIYFVLELLQGGELFTHLRNRGKLTEQSARFYAAIVVYAFSTLHAKKIAYRDLKPENLVMNSKGYVKLVDFGLAKILPSGKTWTLCGTPDYLAPEIILNEGHDLAVDYWALGVLIFEMVVGAPPFYAEDPMEVYEKILSGNPAMPTFFTRNLSDLIKKLLRSQQGKRLGNTRGGTAAVVKHKWFSSFDWAGIESEETNAPFVPVVNSVDDITNFDRFDEVELPPASEWNPDLK